MKHSAFNTYTSSFFLIYLKKTHTNNTNWFTVNSNFVN